MADHTQTTSDDTLAVKTPSRWRSVAFGTVLVVTGGVAGAILAAPGYGFGPGGHDGPPHAFGGFGGPAGWRAERVLDSIDAKPDQRDKIKGIFEHSADDLFAIREKHLEGRKQIRETLAAPTIDRAKVEALRVEQMKLADAASKVVTNGLADAADVLTPAQRAELSRQIERRTRWFHW